MMLLSWATLGTMAPVYPSASREWTISTLAIHIRVWKIFSENRGESMTKG
jgi:hypothetical protein